jgi:AmmeMemoRadiSam system protein B
METVRSAAVAGRFYPGDRSKLKDQVQAFCPRFAAPERARAIMVPHAGYVYSGRFAGEAYRRILPAKAAIILCPNHTGRGKRISVWDQGAWETPLGQVPVDESLAADLLEALKEPTGDTAAHQREHAIEVQLPFLQLTQPGTAIVPVVLGPLSMERCEAIGHALARLMKAHDSTLLIASTDMCHYIPVDEARRRDDLALQKVVAVDGEGLYRAVVENDISMCGFIPTTSVLTALSGTRAELLSYGHSGEVTGDLTAVVAYASAWFR